MTLQCHWKATENKNKKGKDIPFNKGTNIYILEKNKTKQKKEQTQKKKKKWVEGKPLLLGQGSSTWQCRATAVTSIKKVTKWEGSLESITSKIPSKN